MAIIPIKDLGRPLQVGDRVMVRRDLECGVAYAPSNDPVARIGAVSNMVHHRGKIVTIRGIYGVKRNTYRIWEETWNWNDGMFEGVWVQDDLGEICSDATPSLEYLFGG